MSQDSELSRLERFVEKLLVKFEGLREEKTQLVQTLSERDALIEERDAFIEELESNISTNSSERTVISERVNRIVDQIEEWESALELDETESVQEETDGDLESEETVAEENSDSVGYEAEVQNDNTDTDAVEDEGRVQHNLFSMEESK